MKTHLKVMILVILLGSGINVSCSPNPNNRSAIKKLLVKENVRTFTIPGFIARYAMLATSDTREIRPLLKGVRSLTISISDDLRDSFNVFARVNNGLKSKNYSTIMEVIEKDSRIIVKVLEDEGDIKDLVVIISELDSFVCFSMQGTISPENLTRVIASLADDRPRIAG